MTAKAPEATEQADGVVEKHFVIFFSPGTFVAETSKRDIPSWDVSTAVRMADDINERHGATPYGFRFTTRRREAGDLDSKEVARSPMHYLGGRVETLAEVEARNDPLEKILISNMRSNGWNRIIVNDNSWRWTQPLEDGDIVVPYTPPVRKDRHEI